MNLTYKRAHKYFIYCDETGELRWRIRVGKSVPGTLVGYITPNGYEFRLNKKAYKVHRVIWLMEYGKWPKYRIRHLDRNPFNNKKNNFSDANYQEIRRYRNLAKNNESGVHGVSWNKKSGKWMARIKIEGKETYLGLFVKLKDAVIARKHAELYHWG